MHSFQWSDAVYMSHTLEQATQPGLLRQRKTNSIFVCIFCVLFVLFLYFCLLIFFLALAFIFFILCICFHFVLCWLAFPGFCFETQVEEWMNMTDDGWVGRIWEEFGETIKIMIKIFCIIFLKKLKLKQYFQLFLKEYKPLAFLHC